MPIILRRVLLIALMLGIGILTIFLPKLVHSKRIIKSSLIPQEIVFKSDSLNEENIIIALRGIIDPEIGINIYDLGLISELKIERGNKVTIGLLLTTWKCPLMNELKDAVIQAVKQVPKVKAVKVYFDKKNTWTPERMTEEEKRRLK
ncbi:MAG: iron-sulfur cluster assembly protein [candidate division WOR-3 bacterium]